MTADSGASSARVDLIVVGAGIAGLVVAHDAARAGLRVVLLEAGDAVGGKLRRAELAAPGMPPVAIDIGAESFATRSTGVEDLLADLSASGLRVVAPAATGGAHLAAVGDDGILLAPLPHRTVLGIPADPLADDVVAILGADGARRAAAEALTPLDPEPTLAELVTQRCGAALAQRLVDPLCRSVYSVPADTARLSRLHPAMWRELRERGSLLGAAAALAAPTRAGGAVAGIEGGMWRLADALHVVVRTLGVQVRTGTPVRDVAPGSEGVTVTSDGEVLHADRVVVATGTQAARALLAGADSAADDPAPAPDVAAPEVSAPDGATVRTIAALVHAPALDAHPVGSGVIVAADVPSAAKALTHVTAKWEWAAEAVADGHHIIRLSAREAGSRLDDPADLAREITRLTGVPVAPADIVAITSAYWPDAVAAAPVDPDRRRRLAADGIHLAGAPVSGTGLASVIPHARALARDLVAPGSSDLTASASWRTA